MRPRLRFALRNHNDWDFHIRSADRQIKFVDQPSDDRSPALTGYRNLAGLGLFDGDHLLEDQAPAPKTQALAPAAIQ